MQQPHTHLRRSAKRAAIGMVSRIGRHLPRASQRRFLCDRIVPALMDPAVLRTERTLRPLRHLPISVPCDPYQYVHRNTYWCGVFYEEGLEAFMLREVRPGDTFIDIGMNVGHVSLPAAQLVGPLGVVHAVEPQRELVDLVGGVARSQGLDALTVHACGLAHAEGELRLHIDPTHLGGASFREPTDEGGPVDGGDVEARAVPVHRGDALLDPATFRGRVFLKIDAEGYEVPVLRGLEGVLPSVDVAIVEVSPEWLDGDELRAVHALFAAVGLHPHALLEDGSLGPTIAIDALVSQDNVAFTR